MLKLLMIAGEVRTLGSKAVGRRRGFTLFEVAISMVLVSFGVISVMMLFPIGIKAEQMSRLRLYAGVKAEEIIDGFATLANSNMNSEPEAPNQWEVPAGHRPFCPDLETRMVGHRTGIMPVPLEIAKRLDSNNDEIQKILSEGGQLYYSQATGATGLEESGLTAGAGGTIGTDSLTQRLVFAVAGYAQNNNVPFLAQKAWPYYQPYPSPPGHGEKLNRKNIRTSSTPWGPGWVGNSFSYGQITLHVWEGVGSEPGDSDYTAPPGLGTGTLDPDIKEVYLGYQAYNLASTTPLPGATNYLQLALWYCVRKGLTPSFYDPPFAINSTSPSSFINSPSLQQATTEFLAVPDDDKWKYVQALRFLSHAATCFTGVDKAPAVKFTLADLGGQPSVAGSGQNILAYTHPILGGSSPPIELTHDKILFYHELSMRLVKWYSASQPYDWGAPRPYQNPLFTDSPLIEYDLFTSTSGPISGTAEIAEQWKPVAARPVRNIGRSYSFPNTPIPGSIWGQSENFTLARPFTPAERCRQLVFWSVDWMSYEDCETAPSAPIDASKYLFSAPQPAPPPAMTASFNVRMEACPWWDCHVYQYRNPEKVITFTDPAVLTWATGRDVSGKRILNNSCDMGAISSYDRGIAASNKDIFLGRYGADRNFNGKLDRGLLKTSVRLRAASVARYNFYDPRLTVVFR